MKFTKRDGVRRAPLITFPEMAERFGLTIGQMRSAFAYSKAPIPEIVFDHRTTGALSPTRNAKWYRLKDVLAWREADLAAREPLASSSPLLTTLP